MPTIKPRNNMPILSGLIILTPEGKISGYLFGVTYPSNDLYSPCGGLRQARWGRPFGNSFCFCFHYNPITGKYSGIIIVVLRSLAIATIAGFLLLIAGLSRRGGGLVESFQWPAQDRAMRCRRQICRRSPEDSMTFPILPEQASKVAEQTDHLYWGSAASPHGGHARTRYCGCLCGIASPG